ncbi:YggS family pyridoxal phosphate-dependent enzyme [Tistrella bauzanensis]|jgi:pyridoxal phosphate enzyme (YggS family)|uniref:Pyridoxal phosphate homeostasis protein n=1 Tax=Tistrella arctica TaxID=3133430 RepID=A0ABU9YGP6_9PROT
MTDVKANLAHVRAEIDRAARDAGRAPADVTLVAVSKTHDGPAIRPALDAGQRVFGENRVQEAAGKWPALRAAFPDIELHLIGPLQTNKLREAVELFDVIQSVDRPKLARKLAEEAGQAGRLPRLLVQVNTGEEPQKAGVLPADLDGFLRECREELGLGIKGLMCIPPVDDQPGPHFALLADMAKAHDLPVLSMGMSGDFTVAVQLGATHVRVGTAIFGSRPPLPGT